jgi:dihydroorotate dehydrogenase/NAD-dependent dihydropyrimidine dehydrogenase PreA subunit
MVFIMSRLEQTIDGICFKSPMVIGAGPLSDRADLIISAANCGVGAVSIKQTAWSEPRPGVRKMHAERGGYFFNPSDRRLNIEKTTRLISEVRAASDVPLIVNMLGAGADTDTWVKLALDLQNAGASAVELNYACPNPPAESDAKAGHFHYGASMSRMPELAAKVIAAISAEVDIPVWMKYSGDGVDIPALCNAARDAGVSGITTFFSPRGAFPIDIRNGGKPRLADLENCSFGGINGPPIRMLSKRVVAETATAVPGLPIIGGGGISTWEHAVEYIMFGASLCMIFTKVMLDGFDAIRGINEGIQVFMEENGYNAIDEMRGLSLKYVVPNSALDYEIGPPAKVDAEKCSGCGACAKIAYCRSILLTEGKAGVDAETCECCGLCASLCPRSAIYF